MFKNITAVFLVSFIFLFSKACGNINAIDLTKIDYPRQLQDKIDFLVDNQNIYNRWVHDWSAAIPKATVVQKLTFLYDGIDKLPGKNVETVLLLGDIAHYLYNMEIEEYYQKAIDNYQQAQKLAPTDYRVYWFLANHYALADKQEASIQTYRTALQYQPMPSAHALFWADYSVACMTASMYGTAAFAARQTSKLQGKTSYIEEQITPVIKHLLRTPPVDTAVAAKDMWGFTSKQNDHLIFTNWLLGARLAVDSTWNMDIGGYNGRATHMTFTPQKAKAKSGREIGYSILVLLRAPEANENLQQYIDKFVGKYKDRKPVSLSVSNYKNTIAYEIIDPEMYKDIGGGHMYAVAIERPQPEFPGMALEAPVEVPKTANKEVVYYKTTRTYSRMNGPLYYLVLLDSCEFINAESLAVFKDFLKNGLTIE